MTQAVPAGYKQTEVGVIPEDWEVAQIGNFAPLQRGFDLASSNRVDGKYPVVYSNGIGNTHIHFQVKGPGVVTGRSGTLGKVHYIEDNYWPHNTSLWVTQFNGTNPKFVYFLFIYINFERFASGSGVPTLNRNDAHHFKVAFPKKLKEQTAIAQALSDVDALINAQQQLINKKQAIKTATMQQLLTGRTRLPAFAHHPDGSPKGYKHSELGEIPEDWEVVDFNFLFQDKTSKKIMHSHESVTFIGMQDVTEKAQLVSPKILKFQELKSGFTYFEKGDVLVAKITPCFENGKGCHTKNLLTQVGFGSTEFHVLRATHDSDSLFIYYWTTKQKFRKDLEAEMVGSAGHRRVPLSAIEKYKIAVPVKKEQTAIATILSDMDEEIQALEQRLGKTRQIKQGMMQELLTGKTRLPIT